ncbi:MAG TPA: ribonuclease J, partial [Chloroflexota bacterium]
LLISGTQGEPMSALSRVAVDNHKHVSIEPGDTVALSSRIIPGNEKAIFRMIDHMARRGADVLYGSMNPPIHVSGHASAEELRLVLNLVRPRYFVPIHGEYHHLVLHGKLAQSLGWAPDRVLVAEDGDVLEFTADTGRINGRVQCGYVFVDGLGVGDIGSVVLRDRKHLAQDGILVAVITIDRQTGRPTGTPDVISRGFVYQRESEELLRQAREVALDSLDHQRDHTADYGFVKNKVRDALSKFLYDQTKRRPMILPLVVEV